MRQRLFIVFFVLSRVIVKGDKNMGNFNRTLFTEENMRRLEANPIRISGMYLRRIFLATCSKGLRRGKRLPRYVRTAEKETD